MSFLCCLYFLKQLIHLFLFSRTLILCHKHGLIDQLSSCTDPALVLHLSALVVFTIATQNMLHASGRHVSAILSFLQPFLQPEQSQLMTQYHDLVLKVLTAPAVEDEKVEIDDETKAKLKELEEMTPKVKDIATTFKKAAGNAE